MEALASSPLLLVARQELTLALRSRWTQTFAVAFALLALAVATSGYILSGGHGVQDFARTSASLVQLVVLIVPLAALVTGVLALAPERGTAELLVAQPISRRTILAGKLLGLFAALTGAQMIGFGIAGVAVFSTAGDEGEAGYALLVVTAIALTAVFLAIAAWLASAAVGKKRTRALAFAILVWFATVILVDLVTLGVATMLPSALASRLLMVSVMVNPIGAARTGALLGIEGTGAFGAASLALLRFTSGATGAALLLCGSLALWIVVPAAAAMRRFARLDL